MAMIKKDINVPFYLEVGVSMFCEKNNLQGLFIFIIISPLGFSLVFTDVTVNYLFYEIKMENYMNSKSPHFLGFIG